MPPEHRRHVAQLLEKHGIDTAGLWEEGFANSSGENLREAGPKPCSTLPLPHPIGFVVNALGVPPSGMFARARRKGHSGRRPDWCARSTRCIMPEPASTSGRRRHRGRRPLARSRPWSWCPRSSKRAALPQRPGPGGRRDRDGSADGRLHGDGRRRRMDRLGWLTTAEAETTLTIEAEDAGRWSARHGALAQPVREVHSPAPFAVDRCVAGRQRAGALPMPLRVLISSGARAEGRSAGQIRPSRCQRHWRPMSVRPSG